jgi:hypothetical protein
MTGPCYFPRPPRPPGKSQPAPTFHTFTRWLTPWRTIRRLDDELNAANKLLGAFWRDAERTELSGIRLRHCPTHGQQPPNAWGCPECVRELRLDLRHAQEELATAREALLRLSHWGGRPFAKGWNAEVAFCIADWILSGMTGPLPPLPDHMVNYQPTTEDQP